MVEYVWMTAGPDFNAENLAFAINTWNQMIDDMGCSLNANILTQKLKMRVMILYGHIFGSLKKQEMIAGVTGKITIKQIGIML